MILNKRAISPFIAMVLLIAFAVLISVMVTTWGKQLIMTQAEKIGNDTIIEIVCGLDVSINVVEIMGVRQLCYDAEDQELKLTIENGPNKEITGIQIAIISEDSIINSFVDEEFQRMDLKKIIIDYTDSLPIQELALIPQIEGFQFCLEAQITEEIIPTCD